MGRMDRAVLALAIVGLVVGNALACRRYAASEASLQSEWPFLTDDHTLHYANVAAARTYLRESGTDAGYDPHFMAGYARSTYWPPNALLELVEFIAPPQLAARVFKTFVWFSAAAIPLAIVYAGWRLRASFGVVLLAEIFWVIQYWSGLPFHTFHYVQFGMFAFVWSVAFALAGGAAWQHCLWTLSFSAALECGLLSGLAFMAHPTAPVILAPPAALALIFDARHRTRRAAALAMVAAFVAVVINYWWLIPLVTLRSTTGSSPAFFNNPNVWERFVDLYRTSEPLPYLIAPPLIGLLLVLAIGNRRRLGAMTLLMVIWTLLLSIPAGAIARLGFLQVGRNTLHLSAWLCLPAAMTVAWLATWSRWPRALALAALVWCVVCNGVLASRNLYQAMTATNAATVAEMFPHHLALIEELRRQSPQARRLLFEACEGRGAIAAAGRNPFGSVRLSPLVPSLTGLEVVGGPYLATHYRTNFANCGDGVFLDSRPWKRQDADEYFRIYAIDVAALWSRAAVDFAGDNPDLFEPMKTIGGVHLYRIKRARAEWETAGLRLAATYNQITVENPRDARGRFVLPYHATPGWSASSACQLVSTRQADDPVPFLTLIDPPAQVTLRFSPWTLSGPPPER